MQLISSEQSPINSPLPWYALKVRTGSEPLATSALNNRGHEVFVPTVNVRKRYCDRTKEVTIPAFPGYVFCRYDTGKKIPVLSSPGVEYVISFGGVPTVVPEVEIQTMRRASLLGCEPAAYREAGERVHIESGPFAGMEGVVERIAGVERLIVSIHLLQRSVAVEFSLASLGDAPKPTTPVVISKHLV